MALTRKLLESLGIEPDKVSTIIEAHAESVDALKAKAEGFRVDAEAYATAKSELDSVKAELEQLKTTGGDWQKKYDEEHKAFEAFKSEQDAKNTKAEKGKAYAQLLKDAGVSDKRIDSIMRVTDLNSIELENGRIKDAEALAESIKTEWADFITTTDTHGANTQTPPSNSGSAKFSQEEIAGMSAEEINKNWESIKQSMKG